jgi:plastocyanin
MELADKKKVIEIAIAVVVVIALIVVLLVIRGNGGSPAGGNLPGPESASSSAQASPTRSPAPAVVVVPDAGAKNISSSIAVPQVETAAAPTSDSKYRSFDVIVQNGEFMPSTIDVNQGDEVNLQIGAVGGNYDFTQPDYGFRVPLPNGKNVHFEFGATAPGKFVFYCSVCGGPAKGPVGYLIVVGT